ncbi:hypothetical protein [Flavobacterium cerinum]|uniref:Late embryogenesis abundant protein LEA-2 subgroup domain-containing protein n=1 Tax=Flavobacterium cerinum TaxID=2502784 RepID=A0ABY5IVV9_9FLAO|nr:hypothetical protein [Flavobacterium cerinum]UUC45591.1 hypothetical protein NOX80_18465 [Flavobacterium cerinum]
MGTAKKILITGGVIIVGLALMGWNKAKNLTKVFSKIDIIPSLPKNIDINWKRLFFKLDITFTNGSNEDLSLNGYVVTLKRLDIYYDGKYVASAYPYLTSISIPAYNSLIVHDIPVEIPLTAMPNIVLQITDFNLSLLKVNATVDVLGKEYLITQD